MITNEAQIRGLLERAINSVEKIATSYSKSWSKQEITGYLKTTITSKLNQILLLLPPPCPECGGSGEVPQKSPGCICAYCNSGLDDCQIKIPCPACKPSDIEEFVKAKREQYKSRVFADASPAILLEELLQALTHLTTQAEEIKGRKAEKKRKTCMCMDCGKLIKVTEQSKHLKECPRRALKGGE